LHEISEANRNFRMVGSAWSAPGWMKDGNIKDTRKGILGGTLAAEYFQVYANYLTKIIKTFAAIDLPFDAITMQNEPAFSPSDYASMLLNAT
jgi:glucosylceramidase